VSAIFGAVRRHRALAGFSAAYWVGFVIYGVATGSANTWIYAAVIAVLFVVIVSLDESVRFSPLVLFGLSVWGLGHMAGGLIPSGDDVLYGQMLLPLLRFDQVVHAWGFGFAGLATWEALRHRIGPATPATGAFVVLIGGVGFGAINEMLEFLLTRVLAETNVGGFENTGWDLVANTVGASVAALWTRYGRAASAPSTRARHSSG
jgi:hypothetical protein